MIPTKLVLAAGALILFSVAAAGGLAGHWEGQLKGETKIFPFSFDLAVNGSTVTGTLEVPSLDAKVPVTKGTVAGNAFTFEAWGLWTGTLVGDSLVLTRELDGGKKQHTSARRVARPAGP